VSFLESVLNSNKVVGIYAPEHLVRYRKLGGNLDAVLGGSRLQQLAICVARACKYLIINQI